MEIKQFKDIYFQNIRVNLNWDALKIDDCNIVEKIINVKKYSESIYTPWYLNSNGDVCGYDDMTAIQQSIKDVSNNPILFKYHNCKKEYIDTQNVSLPAYSLGHNKYLLLDGNHRMVAAYNDKCIDMNIKLHCIEGEISTKILLDLAYWELKQ